MSSGLKSQITVVGCVSAGGQCVPPMVIWDRKNLPPELAVGEVPGTIYGLSMKGWIDQELFDLWFTQHFLRYAPTVRPLLLLMDGHSSHYCPSTIKTAAREKVVLFTLPPNTTHLTQPLDKAVFGPLKVQWRQACHRYIVEHPGSRISKHNFSVIFSEAWIYALTPSNILSGFRKTGVYPPNRNAIVLPSDPQENLAARSGVAYIPLFSPAKRRLSSQVTFTAEEVEHFETCLDEGTGDRSDSRYQTWLKRYHPDLAPSESPISTAYLPAERASSFVGILDSPSVLSHPATAKSSVRVLTSSENMQRIEEKELQKRAKLREKEERARRREEKKISKLKPRSEKSKILFSEEEQAKFTRRFENGYDILDDDHYNKWLAIYHPTTADTQGIYIHSSCNYVEHMHAYT